MSVIRPSDDERRPGGGGDSVERSNNHRNGSAPDRQDQRGFQPMPALTADEYAALKADVAARGVLVPILVDQHGRLIDGHHRRQVAQELGIDCPTEVRPVASDEEALDLAVTINATRRHLTREQRRDLIRAEIDRRPEDSDRAIARRVGCSPSTVGAVRAEKVSNLDTPADSPMTRAEAEELSGRLRKHEGVIEGALADLDRMIQAALDAWRDPHKVVGLLVSMQREWERDADVDQEIVDAVERVLMKPRIDLLLDLAAQSGGAR